MTLRALRNWIFLSLLSITVLAMACQCFGAAPTVVLYVPNPAASKMSPTPISAAIDCGAADKSIRYAEHSWTNSSGSEYVLDTSLAGLTLSGNTPTNVTVKEDQSAMTPGTVGALAAGEYGTSGGNLYVRLSDGTDPDTKAEGYVTVSFDVSTTGDSSSWSDCLILWQLEADGSALDDWPDRYRYLTDPRALLNSKQIDQAGVTTTGNYNRPQGFNYTWVLTAGTWRVKATVFNASGESTVATSSDITVADDTRSASTVGPAGDYASLQAAAAVLSGTSNIKITIDDGLADETDAQLSFTGDNVYIVHETPGGTRPTLNYEDETDTGNADILELSGDRCVVEGLIFDTTNSNSGTTLTLNALQFIDHVNCAAVNCHVNGDTGGFMVQQAFIPSGGQGTLYMKCSTDATKGYATIGGSSDKLASLVSLVGVDYGQSVDESAIRVNTPSEFWNVHHCKVDPQNKSGIRWSSCRFGSEYGCYIVSGDHWTGAASTRYPRVDVVRINACFGDMPDGRGDTQQITVCNCIQPSSANPEINIGNDGSTYTNPIVDKYKVLHCTTVGNSSHTNLFIRSAQSYSETFFTDNRIAGCLAVSENNTGFSGTVVQQGDDAFDVINCVFPTLPNKFQFGKLFVGGSAGDQLLTITNFNAEAFNSGNTETTVTPDAEYKPDSPTTITTETGVFADFYGWPRDTTSYAGAVDQYGVGGPTYSTFIPGVLIQQP